MPTASLSHPCPPDPFRYAFGITLWELWTARRPYSDVPGALLGHRVTARNCRPTFPAGTQPDYVALAEGCWSPATVDR